MGYRLGSPSRSPQRAAGACRFRQELNADHFTGALKTTCFSPKGGSVNLHPAVCKTSGGLSDPLSSHLEAATPALQHDLVQVPPLLGKVNDFQRSLSGFGKPVSVPQPRSAPRQFSPQRHVSRCALGKSKSESALQGAANSDTLPKVPLGRSQSTGHLPSMDDRKHLALGRYCDFAAGPQRFRNTWASGWKSGKLGPLASPAEQAGSAEQSLAALSPSEMGMQQPFADTMHEDRAQMLVTPDAKYNVSSMDEPAPAAPQRQDNITEELVSPHVQMGSLAHFGAPMQSPSKHQRRAIIRLLKNSYLEDIAEKIFNALSPSGDGGYPHLVELRRVLKALNISGAEEQIRRITSADGGYLAFPDFLELFKSELRTYALEASANWSCPLNVTEFVALA